MPELSPTPSPEERMQTQLDGIRQLVAQIENIRSYREAPQEKSVLEVF